jgi:hypothetical protein
MSFKLALQKMCWFVVQVIFYVVCGAHLTPTFKFDHTHLFGDLTCSLFYFPLKRIQLFPVTLPFPLNLHGAKKYLKALKLAKKRANILPASFLDAAFGGRRLS